MKSSPWLRGGIVTLAVACSSAAPTDANDGLNGTYAVTATFDRSPAVAAGTLTFQQPNVAQSTVLVSGSIQLGSTTYVQMFDGALVGSRLSFIVGTGWQFTGTVSGNQISGRHIYAVFPDTVGGSWTATASR